MRLGDVWVTLATLATGPYFVPHSGRAGDGNGDSMRLAAESGRQGTASTHERFAMRRSATARDGGGVPWAATGLPSPHRCATRQRGWQRAIWPSAVCGWPRSHLRSSTLVMQRLAGRSQACVSLGMRKRVQARSVRMALCGDRGAGGASSRSQRAPAHSRARERCRFKRVEPRGSSCSRMALVAPARQHDGKVRPGDKK